MLLVLELSCTCGGIHPGGLRRYQQWKHTEVSSPGVAAFIGYAAQAKPVRFEDAGASALNTGDANDRSMLGRGVLTTPTVIGPFCRSEGLQSITQT